jgi:hypothetical protein
MNKNESLLDIQTYRTMLDGFKTSLTVILSNHTGFIAAHAPAAEKRNAILAEYGYGGDTFFKPLFSYRLENFHSGMLKMLLEQNAAEIGSIRYLHQFTRLLRDINPSLSPYTFSDSVTVVREAGEKQEDGRIDIFVSDAQRAIIIENKINGAPDQPNQLAKYLRFTKRLEKEIIAVVYIPPPWKNSAPDLDSYAESFQEYIPELREKLVVLPVISDSKKDLVHGFLEICRDLPENTETQKYMLSQYAKLLISIKGAKDMTKDIDMTLLAECYKDKNSITVLENLADIWNNRNSLLCGILRDAVRERLVNELGFTVDVEDEYGLYKNINGKVWLCFYNDDKNERYMFGFWGEDTLTAGFRTALQSVLDAATPEYFGETDVWGNPKRWLLRPFLIGECKKPLSDIAEHLIGRYRFLEETARKALETLPATAYDVSPEYALGEQCFESVRAKLKDEFGYSTRKKDIDFYGEIKDPLYIYIHANGDKYSYWLGFWSDKDFSANTALPKIVDEVLPETYFGETDDWGNPKHWLVKPFRITAYAKASQEDVAEYLAGRLHQLKEKAAQVLKA